MAEPTWGLWLEPLLPPAELAALARQAEEAGASHVFVADEGTERDVFVVLTVLAQATSRVVLGSGITNPFTRHPVAVAAAFATLAEVAPGRIVAGLGTGGTRTLAPLGLDPPRPYSALVECLDLVERLLAGQEVDADGQFAARGARLPWSPGPLPVATAGRGRRVEQLGARRSAWILMSGKSLDAVAEACASIRAEGARAGNAPRVAWSAYLGWSPGTIDAVRPHFTYIGTDMPAEFRRAAGIDDETAERIRAIMLREGMDAAAGLIPDRVVGRYAVVGDRDGVVAELVRIREEAEPDMFLLPVNDYTRAGAFVREAAELLTAAGFKEAG
ncbi:MAG: LLM class flavin-dependent oxidoreductase [Actinomycetota bacterium]